MPKPNDKTKKFLEKHKGLDEKQIKGQLEKDKRVRKERDYASIDYEKALLEYFEKTEPIITGDGITIAEVRYPSYDELMNMVPPELRKYYDDPKSVPIELENKYADKTFEIMAALIVQPKHDAEWWKKQKGVMRFITLFENKLAEIIEKQTKQAKGFPTRSKERL